MAGKLFHVASTVSNSMVTSQGTQDDQWHRERQGPQIIYVPSIMIGKICFLYMERGWKLYSPLVCPELHNSSKITWHHHERWLRASDFILASSHTLTCDFLATLPHFNFSPIIKSLLLINPITNCSPAWARGIQTEPDTEDIHQNASLKNWEYLVE